MPFASRNSGKVLSNRSATQRRKRICDHRLCREADRRLQSAEGEVRSGTLDDLEEEPAREWPRVYVAKFGAAFAVVEDVAGAQAIDLVTGQVGARLEVVVIVLRNGQEFHSVGVQPGDGCEDGVCRQGDLLNAGPEEVVHETRGERAAALRRVEDEPNGSAFGLDGLALDDPAGIDDVLYGRLLHVEEGGVEEKPGEHLFILHRLREMVEPEESCIRIAGALDPVEIDVPKLAELGLRIYEIKQAPAQPAHGRDVELARPYRLPERLVEELHRAIESGRGIVDAQRHRADRRPVRDVERVRKPLLLAVDDDVDVALAPAGDRLRLVDAGRGEAEPAQHRLERRCGPLVDRELQELDALARRRRRQGRRAAYIDAGRFAELVQHEEERALTVDGNASGGPGTEPVAEDFK